MAGKVSMANRVFASFGIGLVIALLRSGPSVAQNVVTQHNDNNRDGVNAYETVLTPSNVNQTQFGLLFKVALDDQVYAQPLVVSGVKIGGGTHNVVYVATVNNSVYAFDANSGTQYWHVNLGTAFTIQDGGFSCQDVLATSGIMGTPVLNTAGNTLYVVAQTFIGGVSSHKLHALNMSTGAEQSNSPVTIAGKGFSSGGENQRAGLLYVNGNVYVSFGGHCDQGDWKGMTFAYNGASLAQVGLFDAAPSDNGNSIWQSGNGPAADSAGNVYVVTGNGAWDGESNFSETALKLGSSLNLLDWHTPSDYTSLDAEDQDLTSGGALLVSGTSLMVAGGKDGVLHVINTANMGHLGDASAVQNWRATSSHIHSLTYWNSNLYLWGQSDYLKVFKFSGSSFNTTPIYQLPTQAIGHPGGSLSISANQNSNGVLWAATNSQGQSGGLGAWHVTEPGILYAYNASNMTLLWTNQQNYNRDFCGNYAKFVPPTISNGVVYLASFGNAQTNSGGLCAYGELSGAAALIPNGTYTVTNVHSGLALGDPGSSTVSGTVAMQQLSLNGGTNEQWTVTNLGSNVITLTNVASGQLLTVQNASVSNGALVVQSPSSKSTSQQWKVVSTASGGYELVNVNSGQVLDGDLGGTSVGAPIDQFPYQGNSWQQWTLATLNSALVPNGTYTVTSVHSRLALGDPGSSTVSGTVAMQQLPLTGGSNQHWTVTNLGNNVITLANAASGQLLTVQNASTSNSALAVQNPSNNSTAERWKVVATGSGSFELVNVNSSQVLDVDLGGTASGELIDQYPYYGNPWQQWIFTPTSSALIPNGSYVVTSVHSALALGDPGSSKSSGSVAMQQLPLNGGSNELWTVSNLGNDVITLTNSASGQLLTVQNASTSNSALAVQEPSNDSTAEQWKVVATTLGGVELVNVNSGQVLDVDKGGTASGELIDQYPYHGNPWQLWIFSN